MIYPNPLHTILCTHLHICSNKSTSTHQIDGDDEVVLLPLSLLLVLALLDAGGLRLNLDLAFLGAGLGGRLGG